MAVPFTQTIRALRADQGHLSLSILSFSVVLLVLWILWLFAAPTYRYVSSSKIEITLEDQPTWKIPEDGQRSEAYYVYNLKTFFAPSDFKEIKPGQKALLMLSSTDTLPWRPFISQVDRIDRKNRVVYIQLEMPVEISDMLAGVSLDKVEIAVSRQTVASFLFHTVRSNSGE